MILVTVLVRNINIGLVLSIPKSEIFFELIATGKTILAIRLSIAFLS